MPRYFVSYQALTYGSGDRHPRQAGVGGTVREIDPPRDLVEVNRLSDSLTDYLRQIGIIGDGYWVVALGWSRMGD